MKETKQAAIQARSLPANIPDPTRDERREGSDSNSLSYPLGPKGFIHHWLVAGPQVIPVSNLEKYDLDHPRPGIISDYYNPELPLQKEPVEGEDLLLDDLHGRSTLPWKILSCEADHFVDLTTFGHTCQYLRSWAHAVVQSPISKKNASFVLTTNGPADVWVNGRRVHRHVSFDYQIPRSWTFEADLLEGENRIVVAFEVIAIRECPYAMALQLVEASGRQEDWMIHLRTSYPPQERLALENVLRSAALERSLYHGRDRLEVRWPETVFSAPALSLRLCSAKGSCLAEARIQVRPGAAACLGEASKFEDGSYDLLLAPEENGIPLSRSLSLRIANGVYSTEPYGSYEQRRKEALVDASRQKGIFAEIAKMELGNWESLDPSAWVEPLERLRQRADCSDFSLLGMLGALRRHGHHPSFPADLRKQITEAALNFRYWLDEPGSDAMCFHTENHQILFHACEVLAGQLFQDRVFSNAGQKGSWHREKGGRLAKSWLHKRAMEGFQEWDSNVYFEIDSVALSHLADLAEDRELATLAAMVLDKLFAAIALNSFRGVFGSTHGRAYAGNIKGGRLELTSGMSRMLWGKGVFNHCILGTVSLACATGYQLPPALKELGTQAIRESWTREHHGGKFDPQSDCREGEWEVNKATWKTEDYMLCSAQDLLPGKRGNQQHVWQATFGPDAVVFTTHPVCISEDGSHRPNFWSGNGILPRVLQWKDFLAAFYRLPGDDWMGFTHAYFPTVHFDEWLLRNGWAFARKDQGYIALTASCGLEPAANATGTLEELRSIGLENVWVCQMGRESKDGSFAEFQDRVLALPIEAKGSTLRAQTLRGDQFLAAWTGPLRINGQEQPTSGFRHYEGSFCTSDPETGALTILSQNHFLKLDFRAGLRSSGAIQTGKDPSL